jgi:pimeloyl-ACP methyl ester carboxylesterase
MEHHQKDAFVPIVSLGDLEMYYELQGRGECLLLLAGIGLDSSYWQPLLAELTENYQVIVLDNRDVGKTRGPDRAYTIADMADDVVRLLDTLRVPRCHVLGYSMGGFIAQSLALRYRHKIQSLVLVATAGKASARTKHVIDNWVELSAILPKKLIFEAQTSWVFSESFFKDNALYKQTLNQFLSLPTSQSTVQFDRQAKACGSWDLFSEPGQIDAPSLILAGADDKLFTVEEIQALAGFIPQAKVEIVPDAAHELLFEQPSLCNRTIIDFCKRHPMAPSYSTADSTRH